MALPTGIARIDGKADGIVIALETERLTMADLTSSLSRLRTSLTRVREQSSAVEAELAAVKKEVKAQKAEKDRQGRALSEMRGRDVEELEGLEGILGLRIEGVTRELVDGNLQSTKV